MLSLWQQNSILWCKFASTKKPTFSPRCRNFCFFRKNTNYRCYFGVRKKPLKILTSDEIQGAVILFDNLIICKNEFTCVFQCKKIAENRDFVPCLRSFFVKKLILMCNLPKRGKCPSVCEGLGQKKIKFLVGI